MELRRLPGNPILTPSMTEGLGPNLNGPSLVAAPTWVADPPGRYYLYFADHAGDAIRLATADHLTGPWRARGSTTTSPPRTSTSTPTTSGCGCTTTAAVTPARDPPAG
jgi:hypothetical protein